MADTFLERHREDYEKRKAAWLRKKLHQPKPRKTGITFVARSSQMPPVRNINKPEDESL